MRKTSQFERLEWITHLTPFLSLLSAQKGSPFFEQPGKSIAAMQIFVRSVDRVFAVNIDQDASLSELKAAIEDLEFIPTGNALTSVTDPVTILS